MPGMTESKCWAGTVKSSGGKENRKHREATVWTAITMTVSNQTKGTGPGSFLPTLPNIYRKTVSKQQVKHDLSFHMTFQLLQGGKIQPCFHLLVTWAKFGPLHANSPLMFFTPFSCRPTADASVSCLRGCLYGVFLSINHAADIRFPSDKSLAQSVRKGGESICLIAVDPSFCAAQPLAKQSSRGVSAQLLPAGVTMEWENAIPGLGKKSGCRQSILCHCR